MFGRVASGLLLAFVLGVPSISVAQEKTIHADYDEGWKAYNRGDYRTAQAKLQAAVDAAKTLGPDSEILASCQHALAGAHYMQGHYSLAEQAEANALAIYEKVTGKDSTETARCTSSLANIHYVQGRYDEAAKLYALAVTAIEAKAGKESPNLVATLGGMADLAYMQAKYADAKVLYERIVSILVKEKAVEARYPMDLAHAYSGLASVALANGQDGEAETSYKKALAIYEGVAGDKEHPHPASSRVLAGLGAVAYRRAQKAAQTEQAAPLAEAGNLYRRALAMEESTLGTESPELVETLAGLGNSLYLGAKYDEAEVLYKRALDLEEKGHGKDNPGSIPLLVSLADIHMAKGEPTEAEPIYQRAVSIAEKAKGVPRETIAVTLDRLATLLRATNREADASVVEERAKAVRAKSDVK